ncbi:ATP-binding cassette domain-containing protein [Radiobacillus sp. PE A8.2]|uniref:ATP-binding cassette domain-containing protein n=1 Tax=Radiobacillus sp. PE A8.2 TaxID=3380349 RepID=UPI003890FCE4
MKVIECSGLTKAYSKGKALNELSFTIEENKITGLIGRNGAGKTTLLKIIAGYLNETSGEIRVFSQKPFNNLKVSKNMVFIDDQLTFPAAFRLQEVLDTAELFYQHWDMDLAMRLSNYFSLNLNSYHASLSKGMTSTFNMIFGLAARCPLTIFDEPTTGMDAAVRKDFYRALLKDYINHPRTILLSSHLLNEIDDLLEDILLINDGQKALHLPVEDLKNYAIGVRGNTETVNELLRGREVFHRQSIGSNGTYVVVKNDAAIHATGLEVTPVSADDLCVYLTNKTKGGIDDVFNRG